ncbi:MAG: helix-turn-helix transcriptional regulator, partial [Eubacteriales bacterium]
MRKKKTQFVILGLLSEDNLSGYEIKKIIDIRFGFFWNESYGQIFPELKLLEKQQFIEIVKNESDSKRDKNTYSITQKGMNALKKWLCEPVEKENVRYEILLKMYFSGLVDRNVMNIHIKEFLSVHQMQLS